MGIERIESSGRANKIAQKLGYANAEKFKSEWINSKSHGSKYDMGYDTSTNAIVLLDKQNNVVVKTTEMKPSGM